MRRCARALAWALLLAAGTARAEAPAASPRPEARAAPEAPGRPEPRPEAGPSPAGPPAGSAVAPALRPGTRPAGPLGPEVAQGAADLAGATVRRPGADEDALSDAERQAPAAPLGPRRVAPAAVSEAWTGLEPRLRPGGPAPTAPARPQTRPLLPASAPPLAFAVPEGLGFVPGAGVTAFAVARSALPRPRPAAIVAGAERARAEAARGQVCGNPLIQGEAEASFGAEGGCGIEDPVRVRSVDGVRLSSPALMDCRTAEALLAWVRTGARPALAGRGGGLARLDVMGDYACRGRNNQPGQRLSEHGRGRAVDVGGLTLADGSQVSVLEDWPGQGLREMHAAACGPFSTVLGPEANAFHRNHFHLDTARGRGPYCR